MNWIIFTNLAALILVPLVSSAPPIESLLLKPDSGQHENVTSTVGGNNFTSTVKEILNSPTTIDTEAQVNMNNNISKNNISTQHPSENEITSEQPVHKVSVREAQTGREDTESKKGENDDSTYKEEVEPTESGTTLVKDVSSPENNVSTKQEDTVSGQAETVETPSKDENQPNKTQVLQKREDTELNNQIESESPQQQTPEQPVTQTVEQATTPVSTGVTTKRPKPSKPKPPRATTLKPPAESTNPTVASVKPTFPTVKPTFATAKPTKPSSTQRYPCRCADGTCSCCSGIVLENFNVPIRSRACANVTYEPDDFAFNFKLAYNNIVLYNRRMSAKNPRPACIPINRYFGIKMCAKLSNVYMSGRNVHACLDFEGFFDDETAFKYSFNCFRIGSQGVAIVRPEDGGGLPPPPVEEEQTDEDYDDSARALGGIKRGWEGDVEVVPL